MAQKNCPRVKRVLGTLCKDKARTININLAEISDTFSSTNYTHIYIYIQLNYIYHNE